METVLVIEGKSKKQTSVNYTKSKIVLNGYEVTLTFTKQVCDEENKSSICIISGVKKPIIQRVTHLPELKYLTIGSSKLQIALQNETKDILSLVVISINQ